MTEFEERVRSGLHDTAGRIPEGEGAFIPSPAQQASPAGGWVGFAVVLTVLVLFIPLLFLGPLNPATKPPTNGDVTPAAVGFEFTNPEHVHLRFSQDLTLTCQELETIDNGGFDSFEMDIWIDHQAGYTRLGISYPDGSTYDLIFKGRPGEWKEAWGKGTDMGRSAGCLETMDDGSSTQSIAGWAFQDLSVLWFTAYLTPVMPDDDGSVVINYERNPTHATAIGSKAYLVHVSPVSRSEFTLDESEIRVMGEQRYVSVPGQFEASASIEVLESGPSSMPTDIFDTAEFTPLWGENPVVTTAGETP